MAPLKGTRHERFAQLLAGGRKQADAYLEAGFKCAPKAAEASASRLRARPDVDARIREINSEAAERTTVQIVDCVAELAKLGFANVQRMQDLAFTGDVHSLDAVDAAALRSVTVEHYTDGKGDDAREVKRVKFEIHDKRGPLVDIIRQLGGFKGGKDGGDAAAAGGADRDGKQAGDVTETELMRRIAFAVELGARRAGGATEPAAGKAAKPKAKRS
jgi:phage terminase small subunit